jgi:ATP-dependent protease HslVU (ClpYQ) peptidase subunit
MSCIVGLIEDDKVWMGADSHCGGDDFRVAMKNPKIIRYGDWLLGSAGQFRAIQVVEHFVEPPRSLKQSTLRFLIRNWVPKVQQAFEEHGCREQHKNGDDLPSCFLIGARDGLFFVGGDFAVNQYDPAVAIGSGEAAATGAIRALAPVKELTPHEKIKRALTLAAEHTPSVVPPFTILKS